MSENAGNPTEGDQVNPVAYATEAMPILMLLLQKANLSEEEVLLKLRLLRLNQSIARTFEVMIEGPGEANAGEIAE